MLKFLSYFMITVILTAIMVSVVSSQLVLADIQSFGLEVNLIERLSVTAKDIIGLLPILLIMLTLTFFFAFIIAAVCYRFLGGSKRIWNIAAGFISFPTTLLLSNYFMGLMVLASARNIHGMFLIACCSAVGGWLFHCFTKLKKEEVHNE